MALMDDYTEQQFQALFSLTDEATAADLYSFFKYRTPLDNFSHFITQTELLFWNQYSRLLRDERVQYDAMVTDYLERLLTSNGSGSTTTARTETKTESATHNSNRYVTKSTTRTDDLTETSTGESGDTRTDNLTTETTGTSGETSSGSSSDTGTEKTRGVERTTPQAISYASNAGDVPDLDWSTPDSQSQSATDTTGAHTESGNRSVTSSGTTTNTGTVQTTGTTNGTRKNSGTIETTENENDNATEQSNIGGNTTGNDTTTSSDSGRTTERSTGRRGYSPAELLQKSRDYILGTEAFRWYCEKFNNCFVWEVEL